MVYKRNQRTAGHALTDVCWKAGSAARCDRKSVCVASMVCSMHVPSVAAWLTDLHRTLKLVPMATRTHVHKGQLPNAILLQ